MNDLAYAIVAALPAIASDTLKASVKDAYDGLKSLIIRKWGGSSSVVKAVEALESNPNSMGQAIVLAENLDALKATDDPDIKRALATLVDELTREGIAPASSATVTVNIKGGVVQGPVGVGQMSIGSITYARPGKGDRGSLPNSED